MTATQVKPTATTDLGDLDPEEVAQLLAALRQKKANDAATAEATRKQRETGYPKRLYNSKFLGESVLGPDGVNRINFYRGVLDVKDAAEEAYVRGACPGRIFEADLPHERQCKKCSFVTASTDCWEAHLEVHS